MVRAWALLVSALLLASSLAAGGAANEDPPFFNEIFDADGKIRPQYEKAFEIYKSKMTPEELKRFLRESRVDFAGDNALDPLPRILTRGDYETLRQGVEQRGTALRMFLQDHYSGRKTYEKVIPRDVLERIITRSGERGYEGVVRPENIAFPYGPDIIRDASGGWRVIEDNPGFIGGIGDLAKAQEILLKRMPEYKDALGIRNDPLEYYRTVVARAKARAHPKGGRIVLYMTPPYADNEDRRIRKLFQDEGVVVVTPHTKNQLVVREDGVYLKSPDRVGSAPLDKVGFVFINGEHKWIDATHPVSYETLLQFSAQELLEEKALDRRSRLALEAALVPDRASGRVQVSALEKALRESNLGDTSRDSVRTSVRGLTQAVLEGRVATNYSPGVEFVGDKEFYTYVDDLVRHYLHEEPILRNLATDRFAKPGADGRPVLDEGRLRKIFEGENWRHYVIKVVDGRGGEGVYVGPKLKQEEIPAILEKIRAHPESYIAQPYTHLSVVDDRIVDLRMITEVAPKSVYVSTTPWGRGLPLSGDGKVNLSKSGREFAVVVVDDPPAPKAQAERAPVRRVSALKGCLSRWISNAAATSGAR